MKYSAINEKIEKNKKEIEILSTGFPQLDYRLEGGFLKKELIVIGAPTGKGKSLTAGTLFRNIATQGYKSIYFSLEISNEMVVSRLTGAEANISPTRLVIKELSPEEEEKKNEAQAVIGVYEEFMEFYDNIYDYGVIVQKIKETKPDFVIIDFIQNVQHLKHPEEYERLSVIALGFQQVAKEVNCCILLLSQLSNVMAKNKRADHMEYKGSGSIATACDLGFYLKGFEDNKFTLELRKNRRGMSGQEVRFAITLPGGKLVEAL